MTHRDSSWDDQTDKKTKLVTLLTDTEGLIRLGKLEDVKSFTVESTTLKVGVKFDLPDNFSQTSSTWFFKGSQSKVILENDEIEYPINIRTNETALRREWFSLIRRVDGNVIENCFDKVKLQHNGDA